MSVVRNNSDVSFLLSDAPIESINNYINSYINKNNTNNLINIINNITKNITNCNNTLSSSSSPVTKSSYTVLDAPLVSFIFTLIASFVALFVPSAVNAFIKIVTSL